MKLYGKLDEEAITDISCNLKAFEENLDADWLPYNCTIVEYDIFFKDGESDFWYDDFIQNFDIESDVIENMYPEDIAEQLKEIVGDKLIDYYTKRLKELQK